jgi:toluene monooxygenase electron transfer component
MKIRINGELQSFDCGFEERLLYAALRQGVEVPYECATGTCGSCRAKVISGEVTSAWPEAPGNANLRTTDEVLLCQSYASAGCELEALQVKPPQSLRLPTYYEGKIAAVSPDADGLSRVQLQLDEPLNFLPGQFVLVSLPGVEGYRAYSPDHHDDQAVTRLSFIVRSKENGALSPKLCSPDSIGTRVHLFGPLGFANVRANEDGDITVVVGGSGSGVALSILEWAAASGHLERYRMDVVCGLRTFQSTELFSRLVDFSNRFPKRLRVIMALSNEAASAVLPTHIGQMKVETGMAHEVAERCLVGSWADRTVFVAGPPPMVKGTLRMLLTKAKVKPDKIRYDSFS